MNQLILHLIGDYLTQSQWMAENKTKRSLPAFVHALVYSLPFQLVGSWNAFLVIFVTHFLIDRYRVARMVVFLKNHLFAPYFFTFEFMPRDLDEAKQIDRMSWGNCRETGYPADVPPWLAVWLTTAADNTLHLAINYCALRWL